jgi:hypothetical protein
LIAKRLQRCLWRTHSIDVEAGGLQQQCKRLENLRLVIGRQHPGKGSGRRWFPIKKHGLIRHGSSSTRARF